VGLSHTCGVTTGSRAFCWGSNDYGQLGNGTTTQRLTPVAVAGGLTFRHVSVGTGHYPFTCGVTTTNRAYCWGRNNYGQLGDSTTAARRVRPSPVVGGREFRQVDAGYFHACGETTDNRAFCWGNNVYGQLGDGTTTQRLVPVAVAGGHSFNQVSAGGYHTCGKNSVGVAYCWGYGFFAQLGNGTTSTRPSPTPVAGAM
jgi:alpha-tubulin suppressor-like RCC1 family protein